MIDDQNIQLAKKAIEESAKAAKEFLGKLINPALEEGGGIISDTMKFWRFKNLVNISIKAKKFLEEKSIEPEKVLPKTLIPLLENGSLEDDENMQNKWAALLANAANPKTAKSIKPSFVEILKELSPLEAVLLDKIFDEVNRNENSDKFEITFDKEKICKMLGITESEFDIIADNLFRLNLCQPPASFGGVKIGEFPIQLRTYKFICFTSLGYEFVKSCRFEKSNSDVS